MSDVEAHTGFLLRAGFSEADRKLFFVLDQSRDSFPFGGHTSRARRVRQRLVRSKKRQILYEKEIGDVSDSSHTARDASTRGFAYKLLRLHNAQPMRT